MKREMTTVFFRDESARFGYRKAIVMLEDVDYFKSNGAFSSPNDFPQKRKPGRPAKVE